jgi:hypothetical protein
MIAPKPSSDQLPSWGFSDLALLALLLVVGLGFRIANFPNRHEIRDEDEIRYATSGLQLFEGVPACMRLTPNGPQTWLGAGYAAINAGRHFLYPPQSWASIPAQIRVFLAADQSLFDTYADVSDLRYFLLAWQIVLSLIAVVVKFRFGCRICGRAGGLLLGGIVSCLPLYVEFASMTRAYSDGWSLTWIAIGLFAWPHSRWAIVLRAIAYGLAVGSRIDMLILAPLFVLLHFAIYGRETSRWRQVAWFAAGSATVAYIVAPWTLLHFVGLARVIATVRFAGQFAVENPRWQTFVDLAWNDGLGIVIVMAVVVFPFVARRSSWPERLILLFTAGLLYSMFSGPYQPMRYHGSAVIALLLVTILLMARLPDHIRKLAVAPAVIMVSLPFYQSVVLIRETASRRADADVVLWIEQNVPAGSFVYFFANYEAATVLPTPESADVIWKQLSDESAYRRKFQRGLDRFKLQTPWIPRAFSEENLWTERAECRRWFILGSNADTTRPRYHLRLFIGSPVFGLRDLLSDSRATGGFVIHRGARPDKDAGTIRKEWLAKDGTGVFIIEVAKPGEKIGTPN